MYTHVEASEAYSHAFGSVWAERPAPAVSVAVCKTGRTPIASILPPLTLACSLFCVSPVDPHAGQPV